MAGAGLRGGEWWLLIGEGEREDDGGCLLY